MSLLFAAPRDLETVKTIDLARASCDFRGAAPHVDEGSVHVARDTGSTAGEREAEPPGSAQAPAARRDAGARADVVLPGGGGTGRPDAPREGQGQGEKRERKERRQG